MNQGTIEVATHIGVSFRTVDHWVRRGYLNPADPTPGTGYSRTWPPAEAAVARRMAVMVAAGVTPAAASRAARGNGWLTPEVRIDIGAAVTAAPIRRRSATAVARAARHRSRIGTRRRPR